MRTLGIYYAYWTQEWEADFIPFISKVKALGFDQLEINGGAILDYRSDQLKLLKEESKDKNIKLSYGIGLPREYDVSSQNESTRKRGVDYMMRMIKTVEYLGGGMIGGTVHSYWPSDPPYDQDEKKRIREQSIKSMKELVKVAEDCDVILNVEVINRFEQFLLNTCEEAVSYVKEIGSDNCRILLDTFHMNIEEDSIGDAIRLAGSKLSAMHIGETNRKPPGMGRMPWKEISHALDDIDFDGPLVMEPFVTSGGQVGRDIGVWRDMIPSDDLDSAVGQSVEFVRREFSM